VYVKSETGWYLSTMDGRSVCVRKGRRRYAATAPEARQGWERLAIPRGRRSHSAARAVAAVTGKGVYVRKAG